MILPQSARSREFGIAYGDEISPKNCRNTGLLFRGGDGVVVVRGFPGRTAVTLLKGRYYSSKAGDTIAIRGSESKSTLIRDTESINIKAISNIKNLVAAYELIKSNPGNMTSAVDDVTLDGLTLNYLKNVQSQLRAGTFNFGPARRINIPKPGSRDKTRPLTIASPREKIVQKAMQMVLEPVYEKEFLDTSHGFRPNKGTYSAIRYLDSNFQSTSFVIEADFSQAFSSISHEKLLKLLGEKIKCQKTMSLIRSGLKAGFVELGVLHEHLITGTPQGSILSPLLCNVFLHELDVFIESLKAKYNTVGRRKRNKEYMSLQNKMKY